MSSRLERPLALTCGDPAGIGAEIALKTWAELRVTGPHFAYIGDCDHIGRTARELGMPPPARLDAIDQAPSFFQNAMPVLDQPLATEVAPGVPDRRHAPAILQSIQTAVSLTVGGQAAGIVTNPISKHVLYQTGFSFPGHTEYLAHLTEARRAPVMMLVIPQLRVVPVTIHHSVRDAVTKLSADLIVATARTTAEGLTARFGLAKPRLAIAALNPHAGEDGALGSEEVTIIRPAIEALKAQGLAVTGPHPVDTLFHQAALPRFDAALCMLHDHALLPLKTLDFDHGVNVTLGLPIVRTSPDHGTAFDIAGKGLANPASLIAALRLARDMARMQVP